MKTVRKKEGVKILWRIMFCVVVSTYSKSVFYVILIQNLIPIARLSKTAEISKISHLQWFASMLFAFLSLFVYESYCNIFFVSFIPRSMLFPCLQSTLQHNTPHTAASCDEHIQTHRYFMRQFDLRILCIFSWWVFRHFNTAATAHEIWIEEKWERKGKRKKKYGGSVYDACLFKMG